MALHCVATREAARFQRTTRTSVMGVAAIVCIPEGVIAVQCFGHADPAKTAVIAFAVPRPFAAVVPKVDVLSLRRNRQNQGQ